MAVPTKKFCFCSQRISQDWPDTVQGWGLVLSILFLMLFLVMHQSVMAETPKPQEPSTTTAKSAETPTPAETATAPVEASFKLKAYMDKKAIKEIAASGKFDKIPQLMLTADIQKVPLRKVLAVLAHESKLKVFVADSVPDNNISAKFDELPLEEGIKQILKEYNYMLARAEIPPPPETNIKKAFVRLTEIRILPRSGEASGSYQLEEVAGAISDDEKKRKSEIVKLAKQAVKADKAEDRLAALEKFTKEAQETDDEWGNIEPALSDQDERVRKAALQAVEKSGNPPDELIADMARTDTSPELRSSALETLVEFTGPTAIPQLQEALKDPDPGVRERAASLLEQANRIKDSLQSLSSQQQ